MKQLLLLLAFIALVFVACDSSNKGSGNVISEERDVSSFERVTLNGVGTVTILQGDTESLVIEAEENILPSITSEVKDGTLILDQEDNALIDPTKSIQFTVSMIDVTGLSGSGSGEFEVPSLETNDLDLAFSGSSGINVTMLDADSLKVMMAGSGQVRVGGQVNDQQVTMTGSGEYQGSDLESNIATVSISGSGKAVLWVNDTLDVDISGSGLVSYYGDPITNSNITGSGALEKLEK